MFLVEEQRVYFRVHTEQNEFHVYSLIISLTQEKTSFKFPLPRNSRNGPKNGTKKVDYQIFTFKESKWPQKWSQKSGILNPRLQRVELSCPKNGAEIVRYQIRTFKEFILLRKSF